ncbi:MAG: hypothetical protein AB1512_03770 [Thermodesulfobacteriota bacterium]
MDFVQKARVRIEHWIGHNDHHLEDYEAFARELESAGKAESARLVKEMIQHSARSTECLRKALLALEGHGG